VNTGPAGFWLQYCDIISLQKSLFVGEIAKVHLFRSASWRNWTYCRIAIGGPCPVTPGDAKLPVVGSASIVPEEQVFSAADRFLQEKCGRACDPSDTVINIPMRTYSITICARPNAC
jgi:hypothetical protein